jgi:hypothetical protein
LLHRPHSALYRGCSAKIGLRRSAGTDAEAADLCPLVPPGAPFAAHRAIAWRSHI